ncbi:MAG: DNA mismatch repair endonuclease MutH [Myxococcales bacterium]|nr:DNA mismatch repair endonuclease MutH [Myxococcales bacterium]
MRTQVASPGSAQELLAHARRFSGLRIAEVADSMGMATPSDQRRAKGFVGQLLERALGSTAGSADVPDFPDLGIELKSLPIGANGAPRESTFVCTVPLSEITEVEWLASRVRRKLARVLWIPVEANPEVNLGQRRIGTPILWTMDRSAEQDLKADWDLLAGLLATGRIEEVTAHLGTFLQVRPKAAHSGVRTRAPEADGAFLLHNPRGFYLRTQFTKRVLTQL